MDSGTKCKLLIPTGQYSPDDHLYKDEDKREEHHQRELKQHLEVLKQQYGYEENMI